MATEGGLVGGLELPVAAGAVKAKFTDPVVEALLDFSAFWLKRDLDAKLAQLTGTSADAVPTANRFTHDPMDARGHQIHLPVPALFVWWNGKSRWSKNTTIYHMRERDIHMMYAFNELPHYDEMNRRSGLMNAVDASMFAMSHRQVSESYGYGTSENGVWVNETLGATGLISWQWMGGSPGRFGIDEGPLAERRFAKKSGQDFPALMGMWKVEERIALGEGEDPGDVMTDMQFGIKASDGETTETMDFMTRYLTSPDGSENDE